LNSSLIINSPWVPTAPDENDEYVEVIEPVTTPLFQDPTQAAQSEEDNAQRNKVEQLLEEIRKRSRDTMPSQDSSSSPENSSSGDLRS